MGLLVAAVGAYGVFLLYTAFVYRWRGVGVGPRLGPGTVGRHRLQEWLVQAGLGEVRSGEFIAVMAALFVVGAGLAFALFGGLAPALAAGLFASTFPLASYRARRATRRAAAREAWPRMIEESSTLNHRVTGPPLPRRAARRLHRPLPDPPRPPPRRADHPRTVPPRRT